jgi:hypothetical protein
MQAMLKDRYLSQRHGESIGGEDRGEKLEKLLAANPTARSFFESSEMDEESDSSNGSVNTKHRLRGSRTSKQKLLVPPEEQATDTGTVTSGTENKPETESQSCSTEAEQERLAEREALLPGQLAVNA